MFDISYFTENNKNKRIVAKNYLIKNDIVYIEPKENELKSPFEKKLLKIDIKQLYYIASLMSGVCCVDFT